MIYLSQLLSSPQECKLPVTKNLSKSNITYIRVSRGSAFGNINTILHKNNIEQNLNAKHTNSAVLFLCNIELVMTLKSSPFLVTVKLLDWKRVVDRNPNAASSCTANLEQGNSNHYIRYYWVAWVTCFLTVKAVFSEGSLKLCALESIFSEWLTEI